MPGKETGESLIDDGLITVADACKLLAVSRSHLYNVMDKGELIYVKIGKSRRLPRRALEAFMRANLHGGWKT